MHFCSIPISVEVNDIINAVLDGTDGIYLDVANMDGNMVHCVQYAMALCQNGEATIWEQKLFSELNYKVITEIINKNHDLKIIFRNNQL